MKRILSAVIIALCVACVGISYAHMDGSTTMPARHKEVKGHIKGSKELMRKKARHHRMERIKREKKLREHRT